MAIGQHQALGVVQLKTKAKGIAGHVAHRSIAEEDTRQTRGVNLGADYACVTAAQEAIVAVACVEVAGGRAGVAGRVDGVVPLVVIHATARHFYPSGAGTQDARRYNNGGHCLEAKGDDGVFASGTAVVGDVV